MVARKNCHGPTNSDRRLRKYDTGICPAPPAPARLGRRRHVRCGVASRQSSRPARLPVPDHAPRQHARRRRRATENHKTRSRNSTRSCPIADACPRASGARSFDAVAMPGVKAGATRSHRCRAARCPAARARPSACRRHRCARTYRHHSGGACTGSPSRFEAVIRSFHQDYRSIKG